MALKAALAGTSAMRNGLDLAGKATALVLLRLLGKLKTHVFRKREIYSKERFKDKENF